MSVLASVAARSGAPARDNGLPTGGELVDDRDIQIAIEGEGKRARYGGCRHHQHVRVIALLAQQVALLHAKAVLLIDNNQSEPLKMDIFLDQRVRADGDHGLSAFDGGASHGAFALFQAAGQEDGTDAKWFQHGTDAAGVLFRQEFGGSHNCALVAIERSDE